MVILIPSSISWTNSQSIFTTLELWRVEAGKPWPQLGIARFMVHIFGITNIGNQWYLSIHGCRNPNEFGGWRPWHRGSGCALWCVYRSMMQPELWEFWIVYSCDVSDDSEEQNWWKPLCSQGFFRRCYFYKYVAGSFIIHEAGQRGLITASVKLDGSNWSNLLETCTGYHWIMWIAHYCNMLRICVFLPSCCTYRSVTKPCNHYRNCQYPQNTSKKTAHLNMNNIKKYS